MPTGILELKLGRPLQMPKRRLDALLRQARRDCCKARNAAIMHWYDWRHQHPNWQPGDPYEAPAAKIKRAAKANGKPAKDSPLGPRLFLSRELYGVATTAAPYLSGSVASSCVQEVIVRLKANTPYNHDGEARWQWQAILSHETSLPKFERGRIPMPTSGAVLGYAGLVPEANKPGKGDVARACESGCALRFALLSKASGYSTLSPIVRIEAGDLSAGRKRLLRKLASGELKLRDSALVEKKGAWFAQLCYEVPVKALGLPVDRVLTLWPALPDARRPFRLTWRDDEGEAADVGFGNGLPVVAEYRRLRARDRAIRYRSRDGCGRGHGKEGVYRTIRPITRTVRDMFSRFEKQTCSDVVKRAIDYGCGAVLYREPTMPVRERAWWAKQDVPFGWAEFEARLKFKCETAGLEYAKERVRFAEWLPEEKRKPKRSRRNAG